MFRREAFRRGDFILVLNCIGLVAGLFVIPVPHRQYYLMFLPLVALFAAAAVVAGVDFTAERWKRPRFRNGLAFIIINAVLLAVAALVVMRGLPANPRTPMSFLYAFIIAFLGVALAAIHVRYGFRGTAAAILMITATIYPLKQLQNVFYSLSNKEQIRSIRYVLENTSPKETVMDGQGGVGVFRPHAYFYWLLDPNIRVILTAEEKDKLLAALRRGDIAPRIVYLDDALRDLSPDITGFFEENYERVNVGHIWIMRPDERARTGASHQR
jgi:hypothetical protein